MHGTTEGGIPAVLVQQFEFWRWLYKGDVVLRFCIRDVCFSKSWVFQIVPVSS